MRKLFSEMWYCGDDICNCTQPQIVECSTEKYGELNWRPPKVIEMGTFHSEADIYEKIEQWNELLSLSIKYNINDIDYIKEEIEYLIDLTK